MTKKSLSVGLYLIGMFLLLFVTSIAEWLRQNPRRNDPAGLAAGSRENALRAYLADANCDGALKRTD